MNGKFLSECELDSQSLNLRTCPERLRQEREILKGLTRNQREAIALITVRVLQAAGLLNEDAPGEIVEWATYVPPEQFFTL